MNINGLIGLGKIALNFVGNNLPAILSGAAVVGTIGTAVLASKAGKKADEAHSKRVNERVCSGNSEPLTNWEKVSVKAPSYIPTALCATATIACIVSAQVINAQRMAALTLTCAALKTQLSDKEKEVKKIFGEKPDKKNAKDVAKTALTIPGDGPDLFVDQLTGREFYSTFARLKQLEAEINKRIVDEGSCELERVYNALGLNTRIGEYLGFKDSEGSTSIIVQYEKIFDKEGEEHTIGVVSYTNLIHY